MRPSAFCLLYFGGNPVLATYLFFHFFDSVADLDPVDP